MSSLIGSLFGTCLTQASCIACTSKCQLPQQCSRYVYVMLFGLYTFFTLFMSLSIPKWIIPYTAIKGGSDIFIQDQIIHRSTLALSIFHLGMAMCTFSRSSLSKVCFSSWWCAKLLCLLGMNAAFLFWLPSEVITTYLSISQVGSVLFLITQIIILIDFAYTLNETLVRYDEERGSTLWRILNLFISCGFMGCMFGFIVYLFVYSFPVHAFFTLLFQLIQIVLSISDVAKHGTLLTSSIVGVYTSFLCFSGLLFHFSPSFENFDQVVHVLISVCSLCFAAHSTSQTNIFHTIETTKTQFHQLSNLNSSEPMIHHEELGMDYDNENENTNRVEVGRGQSPIVNHSTNSNTKDQFSRDSPFFHLMFCVCSMYMGLMCTDWRSVSALSNSMIKIISQWVCSALYIWTLLAPCVFQNRDFS